MIETVKVVDLEEFEEIHAQKFERDTQVLTEDHIVLHVNYIHYVIWVILFQKVEDLQLYACLVSILFLVLYNLQGNLFLGFMIETFQSLND